jgi:hypothetical protein
MEGAVDAIRRAEAALVYRTQWLSAKIKDLAAVQWQVGCAMQLMTNSTCTQCSTCTTNKLHLHMQKSIPGAKGRQWLVNPITVDASSTLGQDSAVNPM